MNRKKNKSSWGSAVALLLTLGVAAPALAVDNGRIQVTVPSVGETSLKLFGPGGTEVSPGAEPATYTDLAAGAYTLRTEREGKVSETRIPVEEDKTCLVKVDDTGDTELLRCVALVLLGQQQQQPWTFGVLGGWKETPFDSQLTTSFGSGSVNLEEDGGSLALEARYNFRRQQQLGARLFLYGTYMHYFGTDVERMFLNVHPTSAMDTGVYVDEDYALHLGIGSRWNLAQRLGLELMLGAHITRVESHLTTLESQGGGTDLRFRRNKNDAGPMMALGLTYPLMKLPNGRPLNGTFRWTRTWLSDINISGASAYSGGQYESRVDGGAQDNLQLGVQWDW